MEKSVSMDTLGVDDTDFASYMKGGEPVRKKWEGEMGDNTEDGEGARTMTNV
jgi:hypothetical protein